MILGVPVPALLCFLLELLASAPWAPSVVATSGLACGFGLTRVLIFVAGLTSALAACWAGRLPALRRLGCCAGCPPAASQPSLTCRPGGGGPGQPPRTDPRLPGPVPGRHPLGLAAPGVGRLCPWPRRAVPSCLLKSWGPLRRVPGERAGCQSCLNPPHSFLGASSGIQGRPTSCPPPSLPAQPLGSQGARVLRPRWCRQAQRVCLEWLLSMDFCPQGTVLL